MADEQLISIITPVFDGLRWLKRAVDSVRGQAGRVAQHRRAQRLRKAEFPQAL